jgi:hypothetical protein
MLRLATVLLLTVFLLRAGVGIVDSHAGAPHSIAILDFELIDDTATQGGPSDAMGQEKRIDLIGAELRKQLAGQGLYRVLDNAPAADLIAGLRKSQPLYACNGCELDIGKQLGADRVLVGWVQKVSNLILNLNVGVKDVRTGATVMIKSVDIRGNTDDSWLRAVRYLVRDIAEKKLNER